MIYTFLENGIEFFNEINKMDINEIKTKDFDRLPKVGWAKGTPYWFPLLKGPPKNCSIYSS